jgi:hypothetical protein
MSDLMKLDSIAFDRFEERVPTEDLDIFELLRGSVGRRCVGEARPALLTFDEEESAFSPVGVMAPLGVTWGGGGRADWPEWGRPRSFSPIVSQPNTYSHLR